MLKSVVNIILFLTLTMLAVTHINLKAQDDIAENNISYLSYTDLSGSLYLLDSDFSNPAQLLDSPVFKHSWSPDGTRLAYTSYGAISNIIILNVETMEESQITFSDAETFIQNINPIWSPDGTMIAFSSDRDGNWEIYVMVLETMEEYRLTNNDIEDGFNGLTWMPDSSGIAYVSDGNIYFNEETGTYEEQQIYLVDISNLEKTIDEDNFVNLTQTIHICDVGEVYHNPSWSIVTNQLAFALSCGGGDNTSIYVIDMTSEDSIANPQLTNLTHDEIDALALGYHSISWNVSGTRLGFTGIVEDDTPSSEIFILDIIMTNESDEYLITQITDSPTNTRFISLSWKSILSNK